MNNFPLPLLALFTAVLSSCSVQETDRVADGDVHAQTLPTQSALEAENDRICKSFWGVTCHSLPHLLGPLNAPLQKREIACVNGTVAKIVSGEWKPRSQPTEACIAISA
jgi:hypothetical protein